MTLDPLVFTLLPEQWATALDRYGGYSVVTPKGYGLYYKALTTQRSLWSEWKRLNGDVKYDDLGQIPVADVPAKHLLFYAPRPDFV